MAIFDLVRGKLNQVPRLLLGEWSVGPTLERFDALAGVPLTHVFDRRRPLG